MAVEQPTERELTEAILARAMRNVHTSMPGVIKSYESLRQVAEVELSVHLQKADGEFARVDALDEVPILFDRGGGFAQTFPLAAGDHVLVTFMEEDPSNWYFRGETAEPEMRRRFGMYAFAKPCMAPLKDLLLPTQYNSDGPQMSDEFGFGQRWTGSVVEIGNLLTMPVFGEFVAMATKTNANLAALLTLLQTWVVVPNDGGQALKTAAGLISIPSVASSDVKVT